jgi:hypothetical protein
LPYPRAAIFILSWRRNATATRHGELLRKINCDEAKSTKVFLIFFAPFVSSRLIFSDVMGPAEMRAQHSTVKIQKAKPHILYGSSLISNAPVTIVPG